MSDLAKIEKMTDLLNNFKSVSRTNSNNLQLLGILVGVLIIVVIALIIFYYQIIQKLTKIIHKSNRGQLDEINKLIPKQPENRNSNSNSNSGFWQSYF